MTPEDIRIFRQIIREEVAAALSGKTTLSPAPAMDTERRTKLAPYAIREALFLENLKKQSVKVAQRVKR